MPAKSKQQQKFMGLVRAVQKGEVPKSKVSNAIKKVAKSMKKKEVEKYASTKHKNLPQKVSEAPNDFLDKNLSPEELLIRKKKYMHERKLNELTPQQAISIQVSTAIDRCDKIIKDLIKNEVARRDKKKALELMKLYKKYWVEFSSRAKSANPLKENINEAKDPDVIAKIRDVVKNKQNKVIKDPVTKKNMRMDGFSASAIIQVYDAINTSNKKKFAKLPILKMQSIAFKFVK
tara:strand:- start:37 stop:735 length:699 start_codon:yes stop_codon:yes gene_type:complete